jgi:uncharacterized SAM-binding protein YcdF (DUF218 family)
MTFMENAVGEARAPIRRETIRAIGSTKTSRRSHQGIDNDVVATLISRIRRIATGCFASLGLLVVVVTATPLVSWVSVWLAGPWDNPHGDLLVVLSGSGLEGGTIGFSSYWRCIYAVMAFREGGFRQIFITGGGSGEGGGPPIAVTMQRLIVFLGVPAEAITVETLSTSTHENALRSVPLLNRMPGKKVLLTSDYHMFRALRVFHKAGLDLEGWPYPDTGKMGANWMGRWPAFLDLLFELTKIAYYQAHGWI